MLTPCLVLLAVALSPGNVVTIPRATPLVAAGHFNWVLRDQPIRVAPNTKAIVTRVAPAGLAGVVEVRVFDGTSRLCWLDEVGLAPVRPPSASLPAPSAGQAVASRSRLSQAGRVASDPSPRRKVDLRRFDQVDAAVASMIQAALQAHAATPTGPMIFRPEVFGMPVFNMPVFHMPVF